MIKYRGMVRRGSRIVHSLDPGYDCFYVRTTIGHPYGPIMFTDLVGNTLDPTTAERWLSGYPGVELREGSLDYQQDPYGVVRATRDEIRWNTGTL